MPRPRKRFPEEVFFPGPGYQASTCLLLFLCELVVMEPLPPLLMALKSNDAKAESGQTAPLVSRRRQREVVMKGKWEGSIRWPRPAIQARQDTQPGSCSQDQSPSPSHQTFAAPLDGEPPPSD